MREGEPPKINKFKAVAREVEADPDEAGWDAQLTTVAGHRPAPEKQE